MGAWFATDAEHGFRRPGHGLEGHIQTAGSTLISDLSSARLRRAVPTPTGRTGGGPRGFCCAMRGLAMRVSRPAAAMLASSPGGLSMRMQGGKTGDVCDAAMPQTRRVCGRFWFSPPPAGGGGRCAAGLWAGVRQESRWGPVGSVESAPARAPSAMGLVRQVDGGADALPTLPTGNAGVAAAGVESVGSAHASRQYGGWSSATRRGARAPFPPFPHQSA